MIAYAFQAGTAIGVGALATSNSLSAAVGIGALSLAGLSASLVVLMIVDVRMRKAARSTSPATPKRP